MELWKHEQDKVPLLAHSSVFVLHACVWVADRLFIELIDNPSCLCCFRQQALRMLEVADGLEDFVTRAELSVATPLGGAFLTACCPVPARSWLESLNDPEMHATVYLLNLDREVM